MELSLGSGQRLTVQTPHSFSLVLDKDKDKASIGFNLQVNL